MMSQCTLTFEDGLFNEMTHPNANPIMIRSVLDKITNDAFFNYEFIRLYINFLIKIFEFSFNDMNSAMETEQNIRPLTNILQTFLLYHIFSNEFNNLEIQNEQYYMNNLKFRLQYKFETYFKDPHAKHLWNETYHISLDLTDEQPTHTIIELPTHDDYLKFLAYELPERIYDDIEQSHHIIDIYQSNPRAFGMPLSD